jgi:hypothetical protein
MFGKKHMEESKLVMTKKKNKYKSGVGIYDLEEKLL